MKLTRRGLSLLVAGTAAGWAVGCEEREAGQGVGPKPTTASSTQGAKGPPGVTDTSIKLGSWGPLSGPAAAWGVVLHAMNAYFAHINASGGIHGRKLELVYRDDQYNPAKTPAVVRELVEKEDVFAIVAGIGTANGRAVADYLEQKGVPFFTPASGDRFWSEGGKKNVFTVFPKYLTEGEILGDYIGKELKAKKVAVLYQNDDFGKQGLEGVKLGLGKHDGAEVVVEAAVQPTDTDLSGAVSQIAEKKPDALVLYCGPKQGIAAVKMLHEQKKKPQVVTSFVLGDPMMFKLAGDAWEGTIASSVAKLPDSDDETIKQYREIIEKYGGGKLPVGTFTMAGFLFALPFVEALNRAGKEVTREKVQTALESIQDWKGPGPHLKGEGFGPAITFGKDKRLGFDQIYLVKAKGGKYEKLTEWLGGGAAATQPASDTQPKEQKGAGKGDASGQGKGDGSGQGKGDGSGQGKGDGSGQGKGDGSGQGHDH
jgi:branched-chain amino acid transport system substrate-binding protein